MPASSALKKWTPNVISGKMNEMLAPLSSSSLPTSQVELTLSCRNLLNTDLLSKSDPYCVVSMKEPWQDQYYEIGRTETINDTLNPQFVKKIILDYNFESIQKIKLEVMEKDLQSSDFLGYFETTLSDLVSFSSRQFIGKLTGVPNKDCGEIIIVTEEVAHCKQTAEIQFHAKHLTKLSFMFSNDAFLAISRSNEDGSFSVVCKTDPVRSTQNPTWKPITIRITTLCNADYDRNIKIDCYDSRINGNHKLIGTCYTTLRRLTTKDEPPMNLVNEELQKTNPEHTTGGTLKVVKISVDEDVTFLDYIRNGTQMHFAVAIDFTASNGQFRHSSSLHYLSPERQNFYEIAIRAVGEIVQHYNSSQLFPAFGFGAKIPPNGKVSHLFPLNGNPSHPFCAGVEDSKGLFFSQQICWYPLIISFNSLIVFIIYSFEAISYSLKKRRTFWPN